MTLGMFVRTNKRTSKDVTQIKGAEQRRRLSLLLSQYSIVHSIKYKTDYPTSNLAQAVNLGGLAQGPPKPDYFDDIPARRSSALIFSCRSGRVSRLKATLGRVLEPFGLPRRLGGSAGPRSPSGIRAWLWVMMPHLSP